MWYVKFISHFVHCLFTLLMVSFPLIIFKKDLWVGKANESLWTTLKLVQGNSKVLTCFHDVGMKWCAYKWSCIYEIHRFSQYWNDCCAFVLSSDFFTVALWRSHMGILCEPRSKPLYVLYPWSPCNYILSKIQWSEYRIYHCHCCQCPLGKRDSLSIVLSPNFLFFYLIQKWGELP